MVGGRCRERKVNRKGMRWSDSCKVKRCPEVTWWQDSLCIPFLLCVLPSSLSIHLLPHSFTPYGLSPRGRVLPEGMRRWMKGADEVTDGRTKTVRDREENEEEWRTLQPFPCFQRLHLGLAPCLPHSLCRYGSLRFSHHPFTTRRRRERVARYTIHAYGPNVMRWGVERSVTDMMSRRHRRDKASPVSEVNGYTPFPSSLVSLPLLTVRSRDRRERDRDEPKWMKNEWGSSPPTSHSFGSLRSPSLREQEWAVGEWTVREGMVGPGSRDRRETEGTIKEWDRRWTLLMCPFTSFPFTITSLITSIHSFSYSLIIFHINLYFL